MNKIKEEMQYALETGWDRDAAIRHGIAEIERLEAQYIKAINDLYYAVKDPLSMHCNLCCYKPEDHPRHDTCIKCYDSWFWCWRGFEEEAEKKLEEMNA